MFIPWPEEAKDMKAKLTTMGFTKKINEFETVDYPCKSRESFKWNLNEYKDSIIEIYPDRHCYDVNDYI